MEISPYKSSRFQLGRLDPIHQEYLKIKSDHVRGGQPLKVFRDDLLGSRYRSAIAMIHRNGVYTHLGNVRRDLPPAEVCNVLKILYDHISRFEGMPAYSMDDLDKFIMASLHCFTKYARKKRTFAVGISPIVWKNFRDAAKKVMERSIQ